MKIFRILAVFFAAIVCSNFAEAYNPFYDIYSSYFKESSKSNNLQNLKTLAGDTIYFEIASDKPLPNIFQADPDTLWLKVKRPKKPKEGKDYRLYYNYKGVEYNDTFYTPVSEINNRDFGLLSVNEIAGDSYHNNGYQLTVVDPVTLEVLSIIIDENLPSDWIIYSKNANKKINKLIGEKFYKKSNYGSDITIYDFINGSMKLRVSMNYPVYKLEPIAEFNFKDENDNTFRLTYCASKTAASPNSEFITKDDYLAELEKKRVYEIDYSFDRDYSYDMRLDSLPCSAVVGYTKNHSYISQKIEPGNFPLGYGHSLPEDEFILIADKMNVRGTDYYKATKDGKAFFIKCADVRLEKPELLDLLMEQDQPIKDEIFEFNKQLSRHWYLENRLSVYREFEKYMKRGLIVLDANVYDESEYTYGTGFDIEVMNTSNQTIKYMTISFIGYNAVDDPVKQGGSTVMTRKCIGPIEPNHSGAYEFEYVWLTDIVEYFKIRSIKVDYKNGTSKTFSGEAANPIPEYILEELQNNSPVKDLLPNLDE